ncbi:MAG: hypothetical protein SX243_12700 [Acidobacteriota bacterium]|nr:hypothetical protein [Acidobacteriota bacterium]
MSENLTFWQSLYCDGRYERCERFKLSSAGVRPDLDLLPNGSRLPKSAMNLEAKAAAEGAAGSDGAGAETVEEA